MAAALTRIRQSAWKWGVPKMAGQIENCMVPGNTVPTRDEAGYDSSPLRDAVLCNHQA
jgi:hypothetical protein